MKGMGSCQIAWRGRHQEQVVDFPGFNFSMSLNGKMGNFEGKI